MRRSPTLFAVAGILPFVFLARCAAENALSAGFMVYSHDARILADRSWGPLETGGSFPWQSDPKDLYYLQPTDESWAKGSPAALAADLKSAQVPGLDWSGQAAMDDARLAAVLGPLAEKPALRLLSLEGTRVSDRSVALLNRLTSLEVLKLGDGVTDQGLAALRLPHLKEIKITGGKITDQGMQALGKMKTLRRIDVGEAASVSVRGFKTLAALPLDQLRLGAKFGDTDMPAIAQLRTLGQLDLTATQVTDRGVSSLFHLPVLHTLLLPKTVSDGAMPSVGKMGRLRRLDLTGSAVTDVGLQSLSGLTVLEELSLTNTAVTDASLDALARLLKLRTLDVSGTRITRAGLDRLTALQNLQYLSFSSAAGSVQLKDLRTLHGLPNLRTLVINGRPASFAVLAYVKKTGATGGDTALGFSGKTKAPWPDATAVEALPVEQVPEHRANVFAGLRQIHQVESDLDHVVPAVETAQIKMAEDTEANFLGEIQVNAGHSRSN